MTKKIFQTLGLVVIVFASACFPKASQVISSLPVESKAQIAEQFSAAQVEEGHVLFQSSCKRCHGLKKPDSRTPEQWNTTLKKMIPRANLSDEEGKLVRAYLISNAKD